MNNHKQASQLAGLFLVRYTAMNKGVYMADKMFKPPAAAAGNARKALRWREKYPKETASAGTQVGWTRARQLASGGKVSLSVVKRMASFARHKKNAVVDPKFKDEPWRDKGYLMYLAWGGQTGIDWAKRISEANK